MNAEEEEEEEEEEEPRPSLSIYFFHSHSSSPKCEWISSPLCGQVVKQGGKGDGHNTH